MSKGDDCESFSYDLEIPEKYRNQIEALAFRYLCRHLQERSELVSNIDLMSTSGFCRNCLAKWLVLGARTVASQIQEKDPIIRSNQDMLTVKALDSLEYKKAAMVVYGCSYNDWKDRYMKKSSDEQMKRYEDSKAIHAKHDDELLKPRQGTLSMVMNSTILSSNVCCQDVDPYSHLTMNTTIPERGRECTVDQGPSVADLPNHLLNSRLEALHGITIQMGILTVSDRAAANAYRHGDLSGPAVEQSIQTVFNTLNQINQQRLSYKFCQIDIVPDDDDKIVEKLSAWSNPPATCTSSINPCDIIFTTGGTGFSPRDRTPEATTKVLDMECRGLMPWVYSECTKKQPLACLSRGIAGVRNSTLIANLPGNPHGVHDVLVILLPLLLHALQDMRDVKI